MRCPNVSTQCRRVTDGQTDRVLVSISRIVKSRRESRGCDFITTTVLNLHSYTKACYFELSLLQELTRPVPFNVDGAQSFSLLNKAMLIIFWVISAHCLQCFDTVSWATGKASAVIWLELYTFESSGCQCVITAISVISRCCKLQNGLTFWYRLIRVVVEYWPCVRCCWIKPFKPL